MHIGDWVAVIAAGGKAEAEIREAAGVENKALARFGGVLCGEIVARACLEAGIGEVVAVADDSVKPAFVGVSQIEFAEPGESAIQSARSGLSKVSLDRPILFLGADLPLLTAESVRSFIEESNALSGFTAGLVSESALQTTYPGVPAKYLRLREGRYVTSAVFGASRQAFEGALDVLEKANRNRKSQFRMLVRFGLGNILRYGLGLATLAHAERAISKALGAPVTLIESAHPATAMDFDTAEDLRYIQALFE